MKKLGKSVEAVGPPRLLRRQYGKGAETIRVLTAESLFTFSLFSHPCFAAGICLDTLSTMPISKSCIISAEPP